MLIDENLLQHWMDHFYGYGAWSARIWFVGYEEGGGEVPEEVAEKFQYFRQAHSTADGATLCDLRELYRRVMFRTDGPRAGFFNTLYDYRFGNDGILHGVWKNIILFVHGYHGIGPPDLMEYQRNSFVSPSGPNKEALIQLYPLPSSHNHAWYYSWLELPARFHFLKSRIQYEQHLFNLRVKTIHSQMYLHKPEVVVMYGMDNINALKSSAEEVFAGAKFRMVKGSKGKIPQHHRADLGDTCLVITTHIPALRHNRIESGFDWLEFGRTLQRK
jgi:hypothetical protein